MEIEERVKKLMELPENEYKRMTQETIELLKKWRKAFVEHQSESPYYWNAIGQIDEDIKTLKELLEKKDEEKIRKVIKNIEHLMSLRSQLAVSELFF